MNSRFWPYRQRFTRPGGRQPRGFVLIVALLILTLLIAVSAELATLTSVESVVAARRHAGLQHELAVESTLLVLADVLDPRLRSNLLISPLKNSLTGMVS